MEGWQGRARCGRRMGRVREERVESRSSGATPRTCDFACYVAEFWQAV